MLLLVAMLAPGYAQRVSVADENKTGHFTALAQNNEQQEVRYMLDAAHPDNIVLQLVPRSEFKLNAHIITSAGAEVQPIEAVTVSGRYANSIDVSRLAPGSYFMEVQNTTGDGKNFRIPFSISAN
jgi:hypothetical protein